jgi:hypothetical protein
MFELFALTMKRFILFRKKTDRVHVRLSVSARDVRDQVFLAPIPVSVSSFFDPGLEKTISEFIQITSKRNLQYGVF